MKEVEERVEFLEGVAGSMVEMLNSHHSAIRELHKIGD